MKAVVNTKALLKELKIVSQVISPSTVIPILTSVKMVFEKNKLTLIATDLETTIITSMECECPKPFTVIVEHKDISDVCDRLNEPISINSKENHVEILGDNYKSKLPLSGNDTDFPKIPEEEFLFSIDADEQFFSAMYCADSCRFKDDIRTNMNTGCLDFQKNGLVIVGTDASVLYKKEFKIKAGSQTRSQVRPRFVSSVKEMKTATVSVGEKFIKVEHESISIISRLQDSKYVDYGVVIPADTIDYNFKVDRVDFIIGIKKAAVTSNKKSNMCILNFMDGGIKITSQDIDFGKEGEYEMRVRHEVKIEAIGFNAKQMLDILEMFDGGEVKMSISSPAKSIYISQPDDETVLCLLQPLMLN